MKEFFYNLMAQIYGIKIHENKKDVYYLRWNFASGYYIEGLNTKSRLYCDGYTDSLDKLKYLQWFNKFLRYFVI